MDHRQAAAQLLREWLEGVVPAPAPPASSESAGESMDVDATGTEVSPPAPAPVRPRRIMSMPPEFPVAQALGEQLKRRATLVRALHETEAASVPPAGSAVGGDGYQARGLLARVLHEPLRRRAHWDALLAEAAWAATDMHHERRWKVAAAAAAAHAAVEHARSTRAAPGPAASSTRAVAAHDKLGAAAAIPPRGSSPRLDDEPRVRQRHGLLLAGAPQALKAESAAVRLLQRACGSTHSHMDESVDANVIAHRAWSVVQRVAFAHTAVCGRPLVTGSELVTGGGAQAVPAHLDSTGNPAVAHLFGSPTPAPATSAVLAFRPALPLETSPPFGADKMLQSPLALAALGRSIAAAAKLWTNVHSLAAGRGHKDPRGVHAAAGVAVSTGTACWLAGAPIVVSGSFVHAGTQRTAVLTDAMFAWLHRVLFAASAFLGVFVGAAPATQPRARASAIIFSSGLSVDKWLRALAASCGLPRVRATAFDPAAAVVSCDIALAHPTAEVGAWSCMRIVLACADAEADAVSERVIRAALGPHAAESFVDAVVVDARRLTTGATLRAVSTARSLAGASQSDSALHGRVAVVLPSHVVPDAAGAETIAGLDTGARTTPAGVLNASADAIGDIELVATILGTAIGPTHHWLGPVAADASAVVEDSASLRARCKRAHAFLACISVPLPVLHTPAARAALLHAGTPGFGTTPPGYSASAVYASQLSHWMRETPLGVFAAGIKHAAVRRRQLFVPMTPMQREAHWTALRAMAMTLDDIAALSASRTGEVVSPAAGAAAAGTTAAPAGELGAAGPLASPPAAPAPRMEGGFLAALRMRVLPSHTSTGSRHAVDRTPAGCLASALNRLRGQLAKLSPQAQAAAGGEVGLVSPQPDASMVPAIACAALSSVASSVVLLHALAHHAYLLDSLLADGGFPADASCASKVIQTATTAACRGAAPPESAAAKLALARVCGVLSDARATQALPLYGDVPSMLTLQFNSVSHAWVRQVPPCIVRWVRGLLDGETLARAVATMQPPTSNEANETDIVLPAVNSMVNTVPADLGRTLVRHSRSSVPGAAALKGVPLSPTDVVAAMFAAGTWAPAAAGQWRVGGRRAPTRAFASDADSATTSVRNRTGRKVLGSVSIADALRLVHPLAVALERGLPLPTYDLQAAGLAGTAASPTLQGLCRRAGKLTAMHAVLREAQVLGRRIIVLVHATDNQRLLEALCAACKVSYHSVDAPVCSLQAIEAVTIMAGTGSYEERLRAVGCIPPIPRVDLAAAQVAQVLLLNVQMPAWTDDALAATSFVPVQQCAMTEHLCEAVLGTFLDDVCSVRPFENIIVYDAPADIHVAQAVLCSTPVERSSTTPAATTAPLEAGPPVTPAPGPSPTLNGMRSAARLTMLWHAFQSWVIRGVTATASKVGRAAHVLQLVSAGSIEELTDPWTALRPDVFALLFERAPGAMETAPPGDVNELLVRISRARVALVHGTYATVSAPTLRAVARPRAADAVSVLRAGIKRSRDPASDAVTPAARLLQNLVYAIPFDDDVDPAVARKQARIRSTGLAAPVDAEMMQHAMRTYHGSRRTMGAVLAGTSLLAAHQDAGVLHFSHIYGPPHVDMKQIIAPPATACDPGVVSAARVVMASLEKQERLEDNAIQGNLPGPRMTPADRAVIKSLGVTHNTITSATRELAQQQQWQRGAATDRRGTGVDDSVSFGHQMPLSTEESAAARHLRGAEVPGVPSIPGMEAPTHVLTLALPSKQARIAIDASDASASAQVALLAHVGMLLRPRRYHVMVGSGGAADEIVVARPAALATPVKQALGTTGVTVTLPQSPFAEDCGVPAARLPALVALAMSQRPQVASLAGLKRKRAYLGLLGYKLPPPTVLTPGVVFSNISDHAPSLPTHEHALRLARGRLAAASVPGATEDALTTPVPAPEGSAPNSVHLREDWTPTEDTLLLRAVAEFGTNWDICREVMRAASLALPVTNDACLFRTGPAAALAAPLRTRPFRSARQCFDRFRKLSSRMLQIHASTPPAQPGRVELPHTIQPRVLVSSVTPMTVNRRLARLMGNHVVGLYHGLPTTRPAQAPPARKPTVLLADVTGLATIASYTALPAAATRPRYAYRQSEKINAFSELRKSRSVQVAGTNDPNAPIQAPEASHAAVAMAAAGALHGEAVAHASEAVAATPATAGVAPPTTPAAAQVPVPAAPTSIYPLVQLSRHLPPNLSTPPFVFMSTPTLPAIASHFAPRTEPFRKTSPYILSLRAKERERSKLQHEAQLQAALQQQQRFRQQQQAAAAAAAAAAKPEVAAGAAPAVALLPGLPGLETAQVAGNAPVPERLDAETLLQRLLNMNALRELGINEQQLKAVLLPLLDAQLLREVEEQFRRTDLTPQQKDDNVAELLVGRLHGGTAI